jgi:hypothetical protein
VILGVLRSQTVCSSVLFIWAIRDDAIYYDLKTRYVSIKRTICQQNVTELERTLGVGYHSLSYLQSLIQGKYMCRPRSGEA